MYRLGSPGRQAMDLACKENAVRPREREREGEGSVERRATSSET